MREGVVGRTWVGRNLEVLVIVVVMIIGFLILIIG
jgi:hypothetical protein